MTFREKRAKAREVVAELAQMQINLLGLMDTAMQIGDKKLSNDLWSSAVSVGHAAKNLANTLEIDRYHPSR